MADGKTIDTGGGASVQGDANTGGGGFTGRDNTENKATGNIVNVNLPTWNPAYSHGQDEGLSVSEAADIRTDIRELRSTINKLADTVGSLDKTLAVEVTSANERIDFIEQFFKQVQEERKSDRPVFDKKTSTMLVVIGFLILVLLGAIAWGSISHNMPSAQISTLSFASIIGWILAVRGKLR